MLQIYRNSLAAAWRKRMIPSSSSRAASKTNHMMANRQLMPAVYQLNRMEIPTERLSRKILPSSRQYQTPSRISGSI